MAFIGSVERVGWQFGEQALPAALFVFDDAPIFPKLGVGLSLGLGLRAGKKAQDAIKQLSEQDGLTPELVMSRWPKALNLATADVVKAQLGASVQGFLTGALRLQIWLKDSRPLVFMAASAARDPLVRTLTSVLGDRFSEV